MRGRIAGDLTKHTTEIARGVASPEALGKYMKNIKGPSRELAAVDARIAVRRQKIGDKRYQKFYKEFHGKT